MKRNILILILNFIFLFASAQRITLAIHQNYLVPDIPIITQSDDTLHSSSPTGNQWFKDGMELPGENKQNLFVGSSGNYRVMVTYDSGCSSESATFNALKTTIATIQTSEFTCKVFPNPNDGMFTIELESTKSEVLVLELFTSDGKSVVKQSVNHSSGTQQIPFGKALITAGIYYLQISFGPNTLSRKIIIN
jgi:hypothetical protein